MTLAGKKRSKEYTFSLYIAALVFLSSGIFYILSLSILLKTFTGGGISRWFFGKSPFAGHVIPNFLFLLLGNYLHIFIIPFFILAIIRADKGSIRAQLLWYVFLGLFTYTFVFNTIFFIDTGFPFLTAYSVISITAVFLCFRFFVKEYTTIIEIPYPVTTRVDDFFTGLFFIYRAIAITSLLILPSITQGILVSYHDPAEKYLFMLFLALNTCLAAFYLLAVRQIVRGTYSHLIAFLLSFGILPDIPILILVWTIHPLAAVLLLLTPLILLRRYLEGL